MIYSLCGLKVRSQLPLPGLLPWTGGENEPDVRIEVGEVAGELEDCIFARPGLQIAADGSCRLTVLGVASYLVRGGCQITVQPLMDPEAADIRAFLLGSVFGFLCHQRGLIPLHAACVEIGGQAVAFTAESGGGKSTLAAAFLRRGYRILADDVTVVDVLAPGGVRVLPTFPRIKLWQEAMDGLGMPSGGLERVRVQLEKFFWPVPPEAFRGEPGNLAAVYHLDLVSEARHAGIEPLGGSRAVDVLVDAVYRRQAALRMGRKSALLAGVLRMASAPVARLARTPGLGALDDLVTTLVARHQSDGAGRE